MEYQSSSHTEKEEKKDNVHSIWRAVGCFLAVIIPVIGFTGSLVLIDLNRQNRYLTIPLNMVAQGNDPYLYIKIGLTVIISLFLYFIFMLVTFLINSLLGPKKYGPTDVPQQRYRGKNYKR